VRKQTIEKFAAEIDALYERFGDEWQENTSRYGTIEATVETTVEYTETS
jgi:hypothetical protein